MKGTKFINLAIQKQDQAYNKAWAEKQYFFSCERCASQGILNHACGHCPIHEAHMRALTEIEQGLRSKPRSWNKEGVKMHKDRQGHVTLTLNNCQNITININGKEVNIDK